jgi:purine-nucleoside phosphorylase
LDDPHTEGLTHKPQSFMIIVKIGIGYNKTDKKELKSEGNMNQKEKAVETAEFLRQKWPAVPQVGLFTGTGLGDAADMLTETVTLDYTEVPHFPVSTVVSHAGKLVFGNLSGKKVAALQGRFHLYEGYSPGEVTFPIRVMQELGVKAIVLTNAAGGLNPNFSAGDIMLIMDHINLTGENPLVGPNEDSWGDRFPDMAAAYDGKLIALAREAGRIHDISLRQGVYAGLKGPSLETPAEVRYLQTIGAAAVGFSTVVEVIATVHAKIPVLALSIITNVHNPDAPLPASVEEIIETANQSGPLLGKVISYVIENMKRE